MICITYSFTHCDIGDVVFGMFFYLCDFVAFLQHSQGSKHLKWSRGASKFIIILCSYDDLLVIVVHTHARFYAKSGCVYRKKSLCLLRIRLTLHKQMYPFYFFFVISSPPSCVLARPVCLCHLSVWLCINIIVWVDDTEHVCISNLTFNRYLTHQRLEECEKSRVGNYLKIDSQERRMLLSEILAWLVVNVAVFVLIHGLAVIVGRFSY